MLIVPARLVEEHSHYNKTLGTRTGEEKLSTTRLPSLHALDKRGGGRLALAHRYRKLLEQGEVMNRTAHRIAFSAAALLAACAHAQSIRPSSVRVEVNDWIVVPLVIQDGEECQVDSMVTFAKEGTTIGNNLVAVWYVRGGEGWDPKSWSTTDRWSIVEQLKGAFQISDEDDYRWGVASLNGASAAIPAENFSGGVLESDPLSPVIESMPDPQAAVALLIEGGYPAALPLSSASGASGISAMLDAIEASIGLEGCLDDPSTLAVAQSLATSSAMVGTIVVPISDRPMGPPGPWGRVGCTAIEGPNCTWVMNCIDIRTQPFIRKRTKACIIGGAVVYCDQSAIINCTETTSCAGPATPGVVGGGGVCLPPAILPAPAFPCATGGPRVPLIPPTWPMDPSVPANCTVSPAGWMPPACACP